jgi:cell division protein ZapA
LVTTHRITVLGKELQVKSSASPEAVREVEEFVNGKAREVAAAVKSGDSQIVAILTLMNIAEAYLDLVRKNEQLRLIDQELLPQLLQRVDDRLR